MTSVDRAAEVLAAARAIVESRLPYYDDARGHFPYRYILEDVCIRCDAEGPIVPQGAEPWCFKCHGYVVLDCGQHVMSCLQTSCGGEHDAVTRCGICEEDSKPHRRNHRHTTSAIAVRENWPADVIADTPPEDLDVLYLFAPCSGCATVPVWIGGGFDFCRECA